MVKRIIEATDNFYNVVSLDAADLIMKVSLAYERSV